MVLVHDWLCGYRGGEAVLERLALLAREHLDPVCLMVMFDDRRSVAPTIDAMARVVSGVGRLPGAPGWMRRWLLPAYPVAVRSLSRQLKRLHGRVGVDLVISSSSAAVKGIEAPEGVPHVCYCHAPARYLWGRSAMYTGTGLSGRLRGAGLKVCGPALRRWDQRTAGNVSRFVANSTYIASEIKHWYGRDAAVVHPPVRVDYFTPDPMVRREEFWLMAGALEPYKRADLVIAAAKKARKRLVIAGGGSQLEMLKRQAGDSAEFLGRVSDEKLRDLYRRAEVLVFPQVEDFGITAVEAQACGLPVLAFRGGGALDSVIPGVTGAFFDEASVESLLAGAADVPREADMKCRRNAERFDAGVFDAGMMEQVGEMVGPRR